MPLQNFVDKVGPVMSAAWLNAVDVLKFTVFADSTTKAAARTALTSDDPLEIANGGTGARTLADVGGSLQFGGPQSTAEANAGVMPTDYRYPPGDVRRYGSVGDGATDDTAAVLAALEVAAAGGPPVTLYGGETYLCSTWVEYSNANAIRIIGNGAMLKGPVGATTVFLSPAANFDIEGVAFDRWGSTVQRLLGQTGSFSDVRFANNRVTNCGGQTLNLERPVEAYQIIGNTWDTCSGGYAIKIGENTYANQDNYVKGVIRDNVFIDLSATGATSCAAMLVYGREVVISGNVVDGVAADSGEAWGIYTKCRYSVVYGNTVRDVNSNSSSDVVGINIKGTGRAVTSSPQGFNTIAALNNVYNIGASNVRGIGIRAQTDDISLHGNHVEDAGLIGIATDDSAGYANTTIADNFVRFTISTGTSGVRVEGNGSHVQVVDNTIRNAITGVKVDPTGGPLSDVRIAGNLIDADTSVIEITEDENLTYFHIEGNVATSAATNGIVVNAGAGTPSNWRVINNDLSRTSIPFNGVLPTSSIVRGNRGYISENGGVTASIPTGTTVNHGITGTPTIVQITALGSGTTDVYVSAIDATTFTINFGGAGNCVFAWEAKLNCY